MTTRDSIEVPSLNMQFFDKCASERSALFSREHALGVLLSELARSLSTLIGNFFIVLSLQWIRNSNSQDDYLFELNCTGAALFFSALSLISLSLSLSLSLPICNE
jgi:hypothetical protein